MTALAAWLLFLLVLAALGLFISITMWRDDLAWWKGEALAERDAADGYAKEADELEELYAQAQEQLYAKLTMQEAMAGKGSIVVVSDVELQGLATTGEGSFTFEKLVTSEPDSELAS